MNIYILSNRDVVNQNDLAGINGENNAEIMYFHFPEQIVGIDMSNITKWIQFKNEKLDLLQMIENDQYSLTDLITQYESVEYQVLLKYEETVLWKSKISELNFDESLDISTTITIDDLSVINQLKLQYEELLKQGNTDIDNLVKKIENLEKEINQAEMVRVESEESRVIAENERVQAESERNQTLANLVKEVNDTISRLSHSIDEYNQNAEIQLNRLENTANNSVSDINSAKSSALSSISNAESTALENINNEKDNVVETIGNEIDQRVTEFDSYVEEKTNIFDENVTAKINSFNTNAIDKLNSYNTNSDTKTEYFNQNYENKLEEINSELSIDRISSLENEVFEKEHIVNESNSLTLEDTEEGLNLIINKIESNKIEQITTSIANGDEYDSPSPNNPSEVEGVTGDVILTVKNSDNSNSQNITISLGNKSLYKGDKIIRKDGKWYFSYIWKKVDDFSRLVSERIGTQGNFRGSMALGSNFKITDKNNHKNGGMSNILKLTTEGQTYNKSVGFTVGKWGENTTLFFYAEELSEIQTSQELREKISELGAYFVLPLKNEEIEEISYTTLISQLNQLLKLKQYEEVTNVDFDKDVTFEIDILNSNFSKLDNINIAQDEEIEKLKAENQLKGKVINGFTDSYDTEIVEGDNITINDCLNVPIKDFKIYGNESKQEILHINSNLFDENNTTKGIAINSNGIEVTLSTFRISEFIRVKYLITYVLSFIAQSGESQTIRVHFYDENKNWLSQVSIVISKQPERVSFNFEVVQNCKYIRVSIYNGFLDVMVSEGSKNIQFVEHQSEIINLTNLPNSENYYIYYDKILYKYFIHNIEILTDTEITDTVLIEQLDKLRSMFLYKGTNHFIVTAENGQPANLKVEVYKDSIKILNDKINEILTNNIQESKLDKEEFIL